MTTYRELQAELQRLHQQAEKVRRDEFVAAIDQIRALIVEYQLLPSDLGFKPERAGKAQAGKIPAKYRDPQSGATWSGRGRPPHWLDGKDRSAFRIAD